MILASFLADSNLAVTQPTEDKKKKKKNALDFLKYSAEKDEVLQETIDRHFSASYVVLFMYS